MPHVHYRRLAPGRFVAYTTASPFFRFEAETMCALVGIVGRALMFWTRHAR